MEKSEKKEKRGSILLSRGKSKKRDWESVNTMNAKLLTGDTVWGVDLAKTCSLQNMDVPRIVEDAVSWLENNGLKTEGVFRVTADLTQLNMLKQK